MSMIFVCKNRQFTINLLILSQYRDYSSYSFIDRSKILEPPTTEQKITVQGSFGPLVWPNSILVIESDQY